MADYLVKCENELSKWQSELNRASNKGTTAATIIKDKALPTIRKDVAVAAATFGIEDLEKCVKDYAQKIPNQTLKDLIQCVSKSNINDTDTKKFLKGLYDWSGFVGKAAIAIALRFLRSDFVGIPVSPNDEKVAKDIIAIAGKADTKQM